MTPSTDTRDRLTAALSDRYRIERELGQGGMATVYLAEDLKHKRKVALKVLKPELAAVLGAERFVQEITTTASLQHPHILPLFDSGTANGFLYYVMPFIDGETLRAKLDRETQLGVDDAVGIARDVASALQYAHQQGVIHRDIKPENILLHDGRPMVADFGIALAVSAAAGGRMTETGLSLGTPHYMSPEQATAEKEISGRSDVYSLATVLYEMLAGQPPHLGGSAQQIIMKIIAEPVEVVTRYRKSVPLNVAAALAKALEKLPADRFDSAKAFSDALVNPAFATTFATTGVTASTSGSRGARVSTRMWIGIAVVMVAAMLGALALGRTRGGSSSRDASESRFWSIALPDSAPFVAGVDDYAIAWRSLDISADGRRVVYGTSIDGVQRFFIARTDDGTVKAIPNGSGGVAPLFSPDGRSVLFGTSRELRRLSLADGLAVRVSAWNSITSFTWGGADRVFAKVSYGCLESVAAVGNGQLQQLPKGGCRNGTIAATAQRSDILVESVDIGIALVDATTGASRLVHGVEPAGSDTLLNVVYGRNALVVAARYLIFIRDSTLFAAPIDLDRARLTGPPVPIVTGVRTEGSSASAQIAVSASGTAVWAGGGDADRSRFVWVSRDGRILDTLSIPAERFTSFALSSDGNRVAYSTPANAGSTTIHVADLARRVIDSATFAAYLKPRRWVQGDQAIPLQGAAMEAGQGPRSDFRRLLHVTGSALTLDSALTEVTHESADRSARCSLKGVWFGRAARDSVRTSLNLTQCALSPDGRMIAWVASGAVYLAPVGHDVERRRVKIGDGGMDEPLFSRDGREVVMRNGNAWYSVVVPTNGALPQRPRLLFKGAFNNADGASWALAPDGRLLLLQGLPLIRATHLNVITNFPRFIEEKLEAAK